MAVEAMSNGYALLRDPHTNKGTAFDSNERHRYGIEGLLPPTPTSIESQVARINAQLDALKDDLQKYLLLSDLQARNETLYYAVLMSDPAGFMPLVYTPTVGEACQKFDHIFHSARGLYIPISAKGHIRELISNWPQRDVRFIVVTDGERILGLGDLGVGGMGIPIGKLSLYTACAGVPPEVCLPITLDVGTNNPALLDDPLYLGLRHDRIRGDDYHAFIDEFVAAVTDLFPKCCIQWEDFANFNAIPILSRYKTKICTYNDDIQGTASIALAGIYAALKITGGTLTDQRFLFLGAGSAATGIADLIAQGMAMQGLPFAEARSRSSLFDVDGLLVASRAVKDFQKPFVVDHEPVADFVDAIKLLKPTAIIGVSTAPKLFTKTVIETMTAINDRPIIFPYSNPTSRSECTAEEAYTWSQGKAVFASGSPFPPLTVNGHRLVPGQGNNVYIFPAMGMAVYATEAKLVTDEMFIVAAKAVAEQVDEDSLNAGLIYPPQSKILEASLHVARKIAEHIFDKGLANVERPADVAQLISSKTYRPVYRHLN
ncbi:MULTISPECIES: NAD-dependent malic enzyme [unclassified Rhizobium]|uniref:NAD-dependent malic enzyme n=1 Tax=unclassified Rhizobium TaxID=2613769 RepID=UPI0016112A4B|nr:MULTISPECIES: NAD-dependent malic enzyme [unclassified Rhizobium]MBB3539309.1 malate dehydrogenase (oxaloacetate-decarboxylating)(NADP+) [Rhizobium sp. BK399]MCS3744365.1 malate dehydrogenase (oxaloacetate-decarboxylating)(NADP+) [Rhizobium sp. BK661]MCS4093465.1 malate dehydrogenase (oxaloacetate-decarboxylating)(NADP+) [Rhizobium sp. BK176]